MTTDKHYKYFAFISYKREDEKWAQWLQCKLENYKLPTTARQNNPSLPDKVRPIFRDTTDLSGGVLERAINNALSDSRFLIVICSPRAAKSQWVCKEVQTFIDSGREENIIPFIIEGQPYSPDISTECYPAALKELSGSRELLGININEMGRDAAAVKAVARMFELPFDTLWQRFRRDARKKRRIFISVLMLFTLVSLITASIFWGLHRRMQSNQARAVAEKATQLTKQGDSYLAQRILLEVLPDNNDLIKRPYVAEAERTFRDAIAQNSCSFDNAALSEYSFSITGEKILTHQINNDTIKIWNATNGKCEQTFAINNDCSKAFSFDQKSIISIEKDSIKTWDIQSGKCIKSIYSSNNNSRNIAFSPNRKYFATPKDNTIQIFSIETGECIKTLYGHSNKVIKIEFSSDGQYIISNALEEGIKLWEINTNKCIASYACDCYHFALSPDNKQLSIISNEDKTLKLWNIYSKKIINSINIGDNFDPYFASLSYSIDGKYILHKSSSECISIYDTQLNAIEGLYSNHPLNNFVLSPDGSSIAVAQMKIPKGNIIEIWHPEILSNVSLIKSNPDELHLSKDGKNILILEDNHIKLWNTEDQKFVRDFEGHTDNVITADISRDNQYIVSTSEDNSIRLWDIQSGECIYNFLDTVDNQIKFNPNGTQICYYQTKEIVLLDTKTHKETNRLIGHSDDIISINYSDDGKYIVSTSKDRTIKLWCANSGDCIKTITDDRNIMMFNAMFSPDGKSILVTYEDQPFRLYDITRGELIRTIGNHIWGINDANFSHNGQYIISYDGIWDVNSGECIQEIHHSGSVHLTYLRAGFSPDDQKYFVIDDKWDTQLYRELDFLPLQELIDNAKERFKDNPLTDEERKEYYLE